MSRTYSYEEALEKSLDYFDGEELPAKVVADKYLLQNEKHEYLELDPDDMHRRIAKEFARVEKNKFKNPLSEDKIFHLLEGFKYIVPQGSPMYGIGNKYTYQSLGNCFTLGPHPYDSYGGICYADQMLVQLSKRRCGVGLCLDNIRPKGLKTQNAAKTTDGIAVFMERYSNSTREVAQSGRRGASLQGLSVHHPEIETFIHIKKNKKKVTGSNISVVLTDEFMQAVTNDAEYEQRWPVDSKTPLVSKMVKARYIWEQIIEAAWESAEPGLLFIDTAKKYGLSDQYGKVNKLFYDRITNPCGEIWEGADSCRLMAINLLSYVVNPFRRDSYFDFELFALHAQLGQRLMDDMVDLEIEKIKGIIKKVKSDPEPEPVKQIELDMWNMYLETAKLGRRTGLGITALGDCLAALGLKYGSNKSIQVTEEIYKTLAVHSMISSCEMAKELGAFPLYDKKIENSHPFLERLFNESDELKKLHNKYGRRNISLTTTAPTGSVSILTRTTSGIEPAYLLEYTRRRKIPSDSENFDFQDDSGDKWEENTVYHHGVKKWMEVTGKEEIEKSPYFGATSNDIDWKAGVKLQAVAQNWITHSISKTCNIPNDSPIELVEEIYWEAYKNGLKGFTVYRDGTRDGVLVSKSDSNKETIKVREAPERPRELTCDVHHHTVKGTEYFVLVGLFEGKPYECFAGRNGFIDRKIKTGTVIKKERPKCYKVEFEDGTVVEPITMSCDQEQESFTRLVSTCLRHGTPLHFMVDQIEKTGGELQSFSKAIARSLKKYIPDGTKSTLKCPECESRAVIRQEGCCLCTACGFSACN